MRKLMAIIFAKPLFATHTNIGNGKLQTVITSLKWNLFQPGRKSYDRSWPNVVPKQTKTPSNSWTTNERVFSAKKFNLSAKKLCPQTNWKPRPPANFSKQGWGSQTMDKEKEDVLENSWKKNGQFEQSKNDQPYIKTRKTRTDLNNFCF